MVVVIQTFGEYLNYHPHLHAIVADGLFNDNGSFFVMPEKDNKKLEQLFRLKVIQLLVRECYLAKKMGNNLLNWRHSGFSVYRGNRIKRENKEGLARVSQYIIRNPVQDQKIIYKTETATVIYRSKHNLKVKGNFKLFKAYDFIEEMSQHIPRKGYQMVRYYGYYSTKKRGMRNGE
ncbi:transposase, partial [Candidatus Magnetomorum sp. HK-1]